MHGLRGRRAELALCAALFVSVGALYTLGAAIGSALFISSLAPADVPRALPWVYVGASLAQVATALVYDRLLARTSRRTAMVTTQLMLALALVVLTRAPLTGVTRCYLLTIVLDAIGLFSIQLFYGLAGDVFPASTARSQYALLAVAMALGTVGGGQLLAVLVPLFGVVDLVYVCAGVVLLDVVLCLAIAAFARAAPSPRQRRAAYHGAPLSELVRSRLVRGIWLVYTLSIALTAVAAYQLQWLASEKPRAALATFFGYFYEAVGVGELVMLLLLVPYVLRRLSVIGVLMLLPAAVLFLSVASVTSFANGATITALLALSAMLNAVRLMLEETLSLPARELLFLPLPERLRVRAQVWAGAVIAPAARGVSGLLLAALSTTGVVRGGLSVVVLGASLALLIALARMREAYGDALRAAAVALKPTLSGDMLAEARSTACSDRPSAAPSPQRT